MISISEIELKRLYLSWLSEYYFEHNTERIGCENFFFPLSWFVFSDYKEPRLICYHDAEIEITLLTCDSTNNEWLSTETIGEPDFIIKHLPNIGFEIFFESFHKKSSINAIVLHDLRGITLNYIPVTSFQNSYFLTMGNLPDGMYIIRLVTDKKTIYKKILWKN